jgi:hypothetical protein
VTAISNPAFFFLCESRDDAIPALPDIYLPGDATNPILQMSSTPCLFVDRSLLRNEALLDHRLHKRSQQIQILPIYLDLEA